MAQSQAVTVVASFQLIPNRFSLWLRCWRQLADLARRNPSCRTFRLLRDRHDDTCCTLISEWDNAHDFDQFVHSTQLLWAERALGYAHRPTTFAVFNPVASETGEETPGTLIERVPGRVACAVDATAPGSR